MEITFITIWIISVAIVFFLNMYVAFNYILVSVLLFILYQLLRHNLYFSRIKEPMSQEKKRKLIITMLGIFAVLILGIGVNKFYNYKHVVTYRTTSVDVYTVTNATKDYQSGWGLFKKSQPATISYNSSNGIVKNVTLPDGQGYKIQRSDSVTTPIVKIYQQKGVMKRLSNKISGQRQKYIIVVPASYDVSNLDSTK